MLRSSAMAWFVYIGQVPTGRYYTGISTDPHKRVQTHNSDAGAKFSHDQGALRLLYVSPKHMRSKTPCYHPNLNSKSAASVSVPKPFAVFRALRQPERCP